MKTLCNCMCKTKTALSVCKKRKKMIIICKVKKRISHEFKAYYLAFFGLKKKTRIILANSWNAFSN